MEAKKRVDLFIKKFGVVPEAFEVCPKFEYCTVNKCPLHQNFAKLKSSPEDQQRKCKCPKSVRREIGAYFKLKNIGLSVRELNGVKLSIQISKQTPFTQEKKLEIANTPIGEVR
jgi:hypothetical protein